MPIGMSLSLFLLLAISIRAKFKQQCFGIWFFSSIPKANDLLISQSLETFVVGWSTWVHHQ